MSDAAETIVAYRVRLGGGRFPSRVIGTLIYGRKPKWLRDLGGWVDAERYGRAVIVIPGPLPTVRVMDDENSFTVTVSRADGQNALEIAQGLAGKVGTVTPLTQADLDREFAEEHERMNS